MSESLEYIGSESNMQIPSETRSKPDTSTLLRMGANDGDDGVVAEVWGSARIGPVPRV